jgi:Raf kinase inhibitor-like YbhB/YbcL family protein
MPKYGPPVLMFIALASCGGADRAANQAHGGTVVDNATLTKLDLSSQAFGDGQPIPTRYTCDGDSQSPPLIWGAPSPKTRSFALVVDDPDAPGGTFRHWGAYNIPATARSLAAGQRVGSQAVNDIGEPGFGGPCPPKGHGPHHYHFRLYALDVDELDVPANAKIVDIENAAKRHAIGQGELIGTYQR